ncbi:MAG TPA: CBS domain-containing protein [Pirellulales bacterium]|jgi:CBS domain-containing protein|nr:CBS domain-containing protein [Pirellulales bacterium]
MYTAQDVMTRNVLCVQEHATVAETTRLLLDHKISGAPVVSADGKLVGVISEFPLLELVFNPDLRKQSICDFVTRELITVTEHTLLSDVAGIFLEHRIRRLPVLENGHLVGLISRSDLLRYSLEAGAEVAEYLGALNLYAN